MIGVMWLLGMLSVFIVVAPFVDEDDGRMGLALVMFAACLFATLGVVVEWGQDSKQLRMYERLSPAEVYEQVQEETVE